METLVTIKNFLWNNKEWLFSGIGVVLIVFIIKKVVQFITRKLEVRFSFIVSFEQIGTQFGPKIPMIFLIITNTSGKDLFVEEPLLMTSEKINGNDKFQVLRINSTDKFPRKLENSEKIEIKYNSLSLESSILSNMNENSFVKFIIKDTLGNKYYSPKLKSKRIKNHNELKTV